MQVELKLTDGRFGLQAVDERGHGTRIDAAPEVGGRDSGARPMELLLMGLGGCSAIDVISILRKQRYGVEHLEVRVEAQREKERVPALFERIHVHFRFTGEVYDEERLRRAIELSLEKYCSVARILERSARIDYSFEQSPT